MWRRALGVGAISALCVSGAVWSLSQSEPFPHEAHARLFPTCLGCHRGIPSGDEPGYYSVTPAECARCHDGTREEQVTWGTPTRTASNLSFVHAEHIAEVAAAGDAALECASCHGPLEPGLPRMAVARAAPETCVGCHAHEAPEHLAVGAACATCHRSLVESPELTGARVSAFPEPPSHAAGDFLLGHGDAAASAPASCAVCHARETCARCHLNAETVPEIQGLAPDPRVREIAAGLAPEWPEPASHELSDWEFAHGAAVADRPEACATCHAEPSCRSCHGEARIAEIAALPDPAPGALAGVFVPRTRPPGHGPDFATAHGAAVAADLPKCTTCHVEAQCAECHADGTRDAAGFAPRGPSPAASGRAEPAPGPGLAAGGGPTLRHLDVARGSLPPEPRPGYHPENFLLRHGAEAFAVQTSCSDCHSTEVFCRGCHQSSGQSIGAGAGAGGAFHDAQPNWFFEHGRAARQGLESCASCHQQTSCLRCHSAKSGLRVNPHGPGFDADRVLRRSAMSCAVCHRADQILPP